MLKQKLISVQNIKRVLMQHNELFVPPSRFFSWLLHRLKRAKCIFLAIGVEWSGNYFVFKREALVLTVKEIVSFTESAVLKNARQI